jgi:hypothetical protein
VEAAAVYYQLICQLCGWKELEYFGPYGSVPPRRADSASNLKALKVSSLLPIAGSITLPKPLTPPIASLETGEPGKRAGFELKTRPVLTTVASASLFALMNVVPLPKNPLDKSILLLIRVALTESKTDRS